METMEQLHGATYDSNVPVQSCVVGLTNSNGCDSTAILNLTINQVQTLHILTLQHVIV